MTARAGWANLSRSRLGDAMPTDPTDDWTAAHYDPDEPGYLDEQPAEKVLELSGAELIAEHTGVTPDQWGDPEERAEFQRRRLAALAVPDDPGPRAVLHSTGPRVHYVMFPGEDNRLSGPFRSKRAAQSAVDSANRVADDIDPFEGLESSRPPKPETRSEQITRSAERWS